MNKLNIKIIFLLFFLLFCITIYLKNIETFKNIQDVTIKDFIMPYEINNKKFHDIHFNARISDSDILIDGIMDKKNGMQKKNNKKNDNNFFCATCGNNMIFSKTELKKQNKCRKCDNCGICKTYSGLNICLQNTVNQDGDNIPKNTEIKCLDWITRKKNKANWITSPFALLQGIPGKNRERLDYALNYLTSTGGDRYVGDYTKKREISKKWVKNFNKNHIHTVKYLNTQNNQKNIVDNNQEQYIKNRWRGRSTNLEKSLVKDGMGDSQI